MSINMRTILFTSVCAATLGSQARAQSSSGRTGVDSTLVSSWGTTYKVWTSCAAPNTISPTTGACGLPVTAAPASPPNGQAPADLASKITTDVAQESSAVQKFTDDYYSYLIEEEQVTTQATNLQGQLVYARGLQADSVSEYQLAAQAGAGSSAQAVLESNAAQDAVPIDNSTGVPRNINTLIADAQAGVAHAQASLVQYQEAVTQDRQTIDASLAQELADAQLSGDSALLAQVQARQSQFTTDLNALMVSMQQERLSQTQAMIVIQQDYGEIQAAIIAFRSTGNYGGAEAVSQGTQADLAARLAAAAQVNEAALRATDIAKGLALATELQQAVGSASSEYVASVATYNSAVSAFNAALGVYNQAISAGSNATTLQSDYQGVMTALATLNTDGAAVGVAAIATSAIPAPASS